MQVEQVLRIRFDRVNHFADFFEQEPHLLEVAVAAGDDFDALEDEVLLVLVLLGVQFLEHLLELCLALTDDFVLD